MSDGWTVELAPALYVGGQHEAAERLLREGAKALRRSGVDGAPNQFLIVAAGFVQSLARPCRNVTGVLAAPEGTLGAKKLELLKAAIPSARRIAVLESDDPAASRIQMPELQRAANTLDVDSPLMILLT